MKISVRNEVFTDKETKKQVEYQQLFAPIKINGLSYNIDFKLSSPLERNIVISNIENCNLITKTIKYTDSKGVERIFEQPLLKMLINGKEEEIRLSMYKSDVFLIQLYHTILTNLGTKK